MKKTVLKPISVPDSEYCWDQSPPYTICEWFDNEGGSPRCEQDMGVLNYDPQGGVRKCQLCLGLKEVNQPDRNP